MMLALDLQAGMDLLFERFRYAELIDYRTPRPPFGLDDAAWVAGRARTWLAATSGDEASPWSRRWPHPSVSGTSDRPVSWSAAPRLERHDDQAPDVASCCTGGRALAWSRSAATKASTMTGSNWVPRPAAISASA
jgi:hypothetical protein